MSKIRIPIFNVEQMLKGYARLREAYSRFCAHSVAGEAFSPNEMNVLISVEQSVDQHSQGTDRDPGRFQRLSLPQRGHAGAPGLSDQ